MKTKQIFAALTILFMLLFASNGHATTYITATGSGNWSSTIPDQPWPGGIVPGTNNGVNVLSGINITVDTTNAICQFIYSSDNVPGYNISSGTVTLAPGSTLTISGQNEGWGTQTLGVLNATATNCTVNYQGNAFWAQRCNYYNLVFSGWGDFYNGDIPNYGGVAMTIFGNFSVIGTNIPADQIGLYSGVNVETGSNVTVLGDLTIGVNDAYDCSDSITWVAGNTYCAGLLWDKDATYGSNYFGGNLTILPSSMLITNSNNTLLIKMGVAAVYGGWDVADVAQWAVGGNLTNNGLIGFGTNYGTIFFNGTGIIAGSNAFTIPTMVINGTYEIADTITLTTNAPTINGTVVFDLANTNQIVLNAGTNWFWYTTNGTLDVINSGAAPVAGNSYTLFVTNGMAGGGYGGGFSNISLPSLSPGLFWVNELLTNGSIVVGGNGGGGSPTLTMSRTGSTLNLTWSTSTYPGYQVYTLTNSAGVITNLSHSWQATGSNTSPATFTINPNGPPTFFRLRNP